MALAGPELVETAKRYLAACVARDTVYIAEHSTDRPGAAFVGVGSLPGEVWTLPAMTNHLQDFPATELVRSEPVGFTEGDVAWFTDYPECVLQTGLTVLLRITLILLREGTAWRAVHFHVSEGVLRSL